MYKGNWRKQKKFFFVYLFRVYFRYYQIRTGIKFAPRIQSATKIEIKSELPSVIGIIKKNNTGVSRRQKTWERGTPVVETPLRIYKIRILCWFYLDDSNDSIYPACVFNDWGVSKTFLIIFKNEEIQLDDQFNFKLSVIVDAQTVRLKKVLFFFLMHYFS